MITINGLNKAQVKLLDTMWSIDGFKEYMEWKDDLEPEVLREVSTLETMVMLAELDEVASEDLSEAREVLLRFS